MMNAPSRSFDLGGAVIMFVRVCESYYSDGAAAGQAVEKVLPYCDEAEFYDNDNDFVKATEYRNGVNCVPWASIARSGWQSSKHILRHDKSQVSAFIAARLSLFHHPACNRSSA